ncbi:unnamed protein product [Symbiodinium sp. CCMP2592]|nr:unnamed protein product [Symbiodinium sp. CCMP2592]
MADPAQVAATPVPEEEDFDLFGPSPGEVSQSSQPAPTVGPQQAPQPVPQLAPVPPAVTTTVGLDPQLQHPSAKASAPPPAPVGPSLHVGSNRAEKYLPALPTIDAPAMGKGRVKELEEYHRWCEVLASWLALIDDNYVNELRQAMVHHREIKQSEMSAPVASRSARLFYYLQQSLQKFERGMELVRSTSMRQAQAACGYEVMRQMHATFSIVSRMEAIAVRDEALKLPARARAYKRPLDVVRFLEDELGKVDQKLHRFPELKPGASDRLTVLLQSVNPECRHYVVLHGKSGTWEELVTSIRFFEEQTRLCDAGALHAVGEKGLCWNCGKAGHYSWQCPDPPKGGKGKGKDKGKGGKPSGGGRGGEPKGKGKGGKKGEKGKDKGKPKAKPKAKSKGRAVEDEPSEQVMALRFHRLRGMRPGKAIKNEPNDAEPPRLTMTDKEVEKLNQSSSRNSHFAWLVDSGATCHVLSVASLGFYEVVKEHSGPLPVLMSASDTEMECLGLVDIRVKFGKLGPVVLQKVLVCQIGFNVISSWQASLSGWCSWFTATPGESCLMKYNGKGSWVWVPLETEARSWWAMAQEIGPARAKAKAKSKAGAPKGTPPKFGKEDDDVGDAMEVDRAKEKAHPSKHPQRAWEVTPFKFLLRAFCSEFSCKCFSAAEVAAETEVVPAGCSEELCEGYAVGSEVCVSSAAVLLKQASTTHTETCRRSGRSASACVSVEPLPPTPQSTVRACGSEAASVKVCAEFSRAACRPECASACAVGSRQRKPKSVCSAGGLSRAFRLVTLLYGVLAFATGARREEAVFSVSERKPGQMVVMEERWRDLREMAGAATLRRGALVAKLNLSLSVEQRRESEELVAMNRHDSKELIHRGFHSLTSPALPSGEPPAPAQEGTEAASSSDDWGTWKERRAREKDQVTEREKDQVAEDKKDHNEGERDKAAEGVALLREQELKMAAASKNLAEKERASAAAKAAANVAVEKWTAQQRARKEAELQAALLAQEQAAATVRLRTLELQLGDALGSPESAAAPEGAVEHGTPPELPASRRISLSSSSVEAITPPGTPPTTQVSPGSVVPKTPQRPPLVKAMPKVLESPASQAAVSLVAPAAAGPVAPAAAGPAAQAAARPAVRVALRPAVRAVQVKAMPKMGQVPYVGHMGPPAPPMVGPIGPCTPSTAGCWEDAHVPAGAAPLGVHGTSASSTTARIPRHFQSVVHRAVAPGVWICGPACDAHHSECVGCASNSTATPYSETFSQAVKSTTAHSTGNSSPYAKEEKSITFDLRRCVSSEVLASTLGSRPVTLKVSSSVSSPKKVQEGSAKAVGSLECSAEAVERLECSAEAVGCRECSALGGNLECGAVGACCLSVPEATPYPNGSTKCLALPRCSLERSCAAALFRVISKGAGFRFCVLLAVCAVAVVVRRSGGRRKLRFGSRRRHKWVRVTLKGRNPRRCFPWRVQRPMMRRLLCLVRKVLKKVAALRGQHNEEAPRIPEAPHVVREHVVSERVVHRARMLAGLPVEITVESEEELLPDPEPKPQPPGPPDPEPRPEPSGSGLSPPEDLEVPVYITSERLRAHRNKGHQPYLSFCDVCQSARGRVPARRKNMKSHYAPGELQVDFGFFGRNDPVPVPAICKALSEMGLNGLDVVVHGKRLVRAIYVGPHGANGSGIRVFVPLGDGKPPRLEIFSSFRARDPVEFDKAVLDQLKGNREDPERPIKFDVPLDAPQPPPDPPALPDGSLEFPVGQSEEPGAPDPMEDEDLADYSPSLPGDGDGEGMDVEPPPGGVLDEDDVEMSDGEDNIMEDGLTWLYEYGLRQLYDGPDLRDGSLTLVLVYVDDLIIFSQNSKIAKELYAQLAKIYKMKQTGILEPGKKGQLEFLGRVIFRVTDAGPVLFGLKPGYLKSLGEEFGISGKGVKPVLGNLEREYRKKEPGGSISTESYERYRRVLGKLMWESVAIKKKLKKSGASSREADYLLTMEEFLHDWLEVLLYTIELSMPNYVPASLAYKSKNAELEWLRKLELV